MTDEVSLRRRIENGRKAAALLEDPFFKEAVEAVKTSAWDQFRTSKIEDDAGRRYARAKLDAIEGVIQSIRWFESDANRAAFELDADAFMKERRA